ncbi:MAG: site-specific integrase [Bacteroidota bacterium]
MQPTTLFDPQTGERKYLNAIERERFLSEAQYQDKDIKYFSLLIYYTGCRLNEALETTPARVDYGNNTVTFRTLKQGTDRAGNPKLRYRSIEVPEPFLIGLNDAYGVKKKQREDKHRDSPIWTFTDRTGQNYVKRIMEQADIKGKKACAKGLRHAIGVALAMNKVPLIHIKEILGHTDISKTQIYTYLLGKERREMVSRTW